MMILMIIFLFMINILVLIPSLAQALDDPVHTALLTGSSD